MDIDKILNDMSTVVDKNKTYLKGLYNKGIGELNNQFGDSLTETRIMTLALGKIGKQYGMSKVDIEILINGEEDIDALINVEDDSSPDILDNLDDDDISELILDDRISIVDNEEVIDDMGFKTDKSFGDDIPTPVGNGWASVMASVPDPLAKAKENSQFEKVPYLIVEIGPTYYLQVDLDDTPTTQQFEGKYGTYDSTPVKVWLRKISDVDLYDLKFTKGEYVGKLRYVDGQKYTLWMDEKCLGYFKMFWMKHTGMPVPDDRLFTFRKSKKGKFNVFTFKIPK